MTTTTRTWDRFANAALEDLRAYFAPPGTGGADHWAWLISQPHPVATCRARATGAWDANLGDQYSAYSRLGDLLEAGAVYVLAVEGEDPTATTLAEFLEINPYLDQEPLLALERGQALDGGGGAGSSWSIRRC
jgi:hypothetical protein